ncbi:MAG: EpsI family protein [Thermodesulfobacteriota bacterium]|nr:EpsI family protein [Thermodesulfobacteriota bacterium]
MKSLTASKPISWMKAALYGLLLVGIYYSTATYLVQQWSRDDFTYCYLIPLIVLYFIWEKRQDLLDMPSMPSWTGVWCFALGMGFFWLGELGGEYFTLYFSSWLALVGLCWLQLGWQKLKIIAFPLAMALAMFPLPGFLYGKISVQLKLISSQLGVALMQLYGMSAYREGNVIDLGFTQLQVVDACSGLRYLIPLIVLGLLLAYMFKAAFWKRAVVVISTVPLSIITNSIRIALTGILYEMAGPKVAEGFFHGFSGWFIFMFSLVVLLGEMKVLGFQFKAKKSDESRVTGDKRDSDELRSTVNGERSTPQGARQEKAEGSKLRAQGSDEQKAQEAQGEGHKAQGSEHSPLTDNGKRSTPQGLKTLLHPPQFIVAVILLGLTFGLSQGVEFREKIPISQSFDHFPMKVGVWSGTSQTMEQRFIDRLDLSDYVLIDYKDDRGRSVNFYVAYYESQRKGESIHSPATCLPGGGWLFKEAGRTSVPVPAVKDGAMPVNRALMQKGDVRQLSYYWFPQRGRVLTNAYQLKIYAFWDALTRQRTDGALVRLITPVYEFEDLQDAEDRLQAFVRDIVPVLGEYIPD